MAPKIGAFGFLFAAENVSIHLGTQRRSGPAMTENSKLIADLLAGRCQQISRLAEHQGVIETIRADIAAIEATLQICAPDLGERLRKQQTPSHRIEFEKGEALQLSLIALKKIGRPAAIHEIANIVATLKHADASKVPSIVKSLYYYLSKGAAEGYLKQASSGGASPLWEPAPITMRRARKLSFKTGEGMQLTLDALREIGRPALASEIAVVVARRKGVSIHLGMRISSFASLRACKLRI
jgi:hypothetical protein